MSTKSSPVQIAALYSTTNVQSPTFLSNSWSQLSVGNSHVLALKSDSTLWVWGRNNYGQLGDATLIDKNSPVQLGTSSWTIVSAGSDYSMGITTDNKMFSWGRNDLGILGDDRPAKSNFWKDISIGFNTTLGIRYDDTLWAWGQNTSGKLGDGTTINRSSPVQIGTNSWTNVATTSVTSAAIKADGTLWAWGRNQTGQIGDGTTIDKSSPVQVAGNQLWSKVSMASAALSTGAAVMAINRTGQLFGWGINTSGMLGLGDTVARNSPTVVGGRTDWAFVDVSNNHAAALTTSDTLFTWGINTYGQLGNNTVAARSNPIQVGFNSWKKIASGDGFIFGISSNNTLWAWGRNDYGQLGDSTTINKSSPTQISTSSWAMVAVRASSIAALTVDNKLFTWGAYGNFLGTGDTSNRSSPTQVSTSSWSAVTAGISYNIFFVEDINSNWFGFGNGGTVGSFGDLSIADTRSSPSQIGIGYMNISPTQIGASSWTSVSAGYSHVVAIRSDKTLWSWGKADVGQLGNPDIYTVRSSPVQVSASSYTLIDAGNDSSAAIDINGKLYTWGNNINGQLGYTSTTDIKSWSVISGNSDFTLAIRQDGTLWSWGRNNTGQLGLGDTINRSSPVVVTSGSWIAIAAGLGHSLAVDSAGRVFSWGTNTYGELGLGDVVNRSSPVQITNGSYSDVLAVSAGANTSYLIRENSGYKTLLSFGRNLDGQLGDNSGVDKSYPVGVLNYITKVVALYSSAIALYNNQIVYTFGNNTYGQLGTNDTVPRSNPVQISTLYYSWPNIFGGNLGYTAWAIDQSNRLVGWGRNDVGQIGDDTIVNKSSPTVVSAYSWTSVVGSPLNSTLGVRDDGTLFGWGAKTPLLGKFNEVSIFTYSWSQLSSGFNHSAGIRADDRMYVWGINPYGQIGNNSTATATRPSPVTIVETIGLLTNYYNFFKGLSTSSDSTFAITTDGKLFSWGRNDRGQLGNSNWGFSVSSPVQIGTSSWAVVSSGLNHTLAIDAVGRLFSWGVNDSSQLGNGDTINRSSPVLLGSSSWSFVSAANDQSFAIDTAGRLFAWGENGMGQLGLPITTSWKTIRGMSRSTMLLSYDGILYGQGYDSDGAGTGPTRSSPVQIGTAPYYAYASGTSWNQVAGDYESILALRTDGTLFAWGLNTDGQLGIDIAGPFVTRPTQVTGSWTMVSHSENQTLAIKTNGTLWAWGYNSFGALGLDDIVSRSSPVQIGTDSWKFIDTAGLSAGNGCTFGVKNDNTIWAWGINSQGQLGDGTTISRSSPVQVLSDFNWSNITTLSARGYILTTDNKLYAWGDNSDWQRMRTAFSNTVAIAPVQLPGRWSSVVAGAVGNAQTRLAIDTNGYLFAWGNNANGLMGLGDALSRSSPAQVGSSRYSKIHSCDFVSYVEREDGTVWASGVNTDYQYSTYDYLAISKSSPVQINTYSRVNSPTQVTSLSFTSVSASKMNTFAYTSSNTLYAWGSNELSQMGYVSPTTFKALPDSEASSVITNDGKLFMWGYNIYGQGDGSTVTYTTPLLLTGAGQSYSTISKSKNSTGFHVIAIGNDNKLYAWGYNANGQLGDGTIINRSGAVQIGNQSWLAVASSQSHSLAISSDGTLWGWGSSANIGRMSWKQASVGFQFSMFLRSDGLLSSTGENTSGQLAFGNSTGRRSSPVQISTTLSSFSVDKVVAGYQAGVAISGNGALFAWGANTNGLQGINPGTTGTINTIDAGDSWSSIAVWQHAAAISTTGKLITWGLNSNGQLGDSTTIDRSSPVVISGSWVSVSVGISNTIAVRADGKLFTWGGNSSGYLGDGTTINKSSPVQVGNSSWSFVKSGSSGQNFAVRIDGLLFGWGANQFGELGIGDTTTTLSSPVQIGTSSWTSISAGTGHTLGITTTGANMGWGNNTYGQLGNPTQGTTTGWNQLIGGYFANRSDGSTFAWAQPAGVIGGPDFYQTGTKSSPVQVGTNWLKSSNSYFDGARFVIKDDYSLWAWGNNGSGQLGVGDTVARATATQVPGSWIHVAAGRQRTFAINSDGIGFAWGENGAGTLGVGDIINRSSPVQIAGSVSGWTYVDAGYGVALGLKSDGTMWNWATSSPVQIGTDTDWAQIQVAGEDFGAIKNDGRLFAWGSNRTGVFGNNTTGGGNSNPTQYVTGSWSMIAMGSGGSTPNNPYILGIRSDGTLYGWGVNTYGELGHNTTSNTSSPVQVGTSSSWTYVASAKGEVSYGINNSLLYAWGYGVTGEVPSLTSISRSSPTQIGDTYNTSVYAPTLLSTSYTQLNAGSFNTVAVDTYNAALRVYGNNASGALGDNTTITQSSPVQIGTATLNESRSSPTQIDSGSWLKIAASDNSSAAIRADGKLFTWGINTNGELGNDTTTSSYSLTQLGSDSWLAISAGTSSIVGIKTDNTLWTWGANPNGQLGDNTIISRSSPVQVSGSWLTVSMGRNHIIAIQTNGTLYAWGNNTYGYLGDGTTIFRSSPVQIGTLTDWTSVAAGIDQSAAMRDNKLYGWGLGGRTGDGTVIDRSSPVLILTPYNWSTATLSSPTQISGNPYTSIQSTLWGGSALKSDGSLWTWGFNGYSESSPANYGYQNKLVPSPIQIGTSSWTILGGKLYSLFGVKSDGTLWGWGRNNSYELGINVDNFNRSSPVQVAADTTTNLQVPTIMQNVLGSSFTQVQAGSVVTVMAASSTISTWGSGSYGQLGSGSLNTTSYPTFVGGNLQSFSGAIRAVGTSSWKTVSAGAEHMLGVNSSNTLFGWGNYAGTYKLPVYWTTISGGASHVVGLQSDGSIWTWGKNIYGNLGLGDTFNRSLPAQVGNNSWLAVSAGDEHIVALKSDYTLWAWGRNSTGQVGDNTVVSKSSPVQIGTASWSQLIAGASHTAAVTSDNRLFVWGQGTSGQIGNTEAVNKSSPTQIMSDKSFNMISASLDSTYVITSDNLLFSFGSNDTGQLGLNDVSARSSPVQVGTDTYRFVTSRYKSFMAIKYTGELVVGGYNATGQLGLNDVINRASPVQLGTFTWKNAVFSSTGTTMTAQGQRQDNTLWVWGSATSGKLGDGTTIAKSSPVQITALSYGQVASGTQNATFLLSSFGELFAMGTGAVGERGDGTVGITIQQRSNPTQLATTGTSSPVVIASGQWAKVNAGPNTSLAAKTSGALFVWGDNTSAKLANATGLNNYLSSPVQLATGVSVLSVEGNTSGVIQNQ